ncbi:MAG TPA: DUF1127 domain-containing protein [Ferrovibrio sp.]|uniref:DUF1127 domain-containing protein n=1 Tax=Ferrovibrio sp. TaxID=1917215 RepID=UPI002ED17F91
MKTPHFDKPATLTSYPYHFLGLADYVQLEMEARRMRARAIAAFLAGCWKALTAGLRRRAAEAELRSLDDRTLHDMGLSRSSIPAAVAGEIHRPAAPSNENADEAKVRPLTVQPIEVQAEAAA